jgi:hypothetical protein
VINRTNKNSKVTIDDINPAPNNIPETPADSEKESRDWQQKFNELSVRHFKLEEENSKLRQNHITSELLNQLIEPYAKKSFRYMVGYSLAVGVLLFLCGFKIGGFSLSEQVQSFLVGSTAVTVIGLVGMVLSGIFLGARKN